MLSNFTLLYVEENKETIENLKEILEDKVKEFYVAYDGEEGFKIFQEKKPDIVLTDINMPKLNGIEMAKKIRTINKTQPILILTDFNENHLLFESVDIGVDGYITKPIHDIKKFLEPLEKTADRLQRYIDQKNLERLLEVQGKASAVGEMIGNIAHQWRQPLSVISLLASDVKFSMEQKKVLSFDKIKECADFIIDQTNYLSQTIDDFRNFLRADTSNKKFISLKKVLEKTCAIVNISMKDNNITCIKNIKDINIFGNENMLIQALINICNNSKDAIVQNNIKERYFFVKTQEINNNAVITIKDSGGGIREDVVDKIFESYFTTKDRSIGTGIGLYITRKTITKSFNGTVKVRNIEYEYNGKKLKGAEFIVSLPL